MIATMPTAEDPTSRKVKRVLGFGLQSWEQLMLLSLGIAGLVAVGVFITTASVVILQRRETAEAKKELESYKLEAGEKIAAADAAGKAAQADAAKAVAETAKANERVAELTQETEKLRANNLEMERAFSPRSLTIRSEDTARLQAFGKVRWTMVFVERDEPRDTAGQIAFLLGQARWERFEGPIPERPGIMDGVGIYLSDEAARPAADALADILRASDIDTTVRYVGRWRLKAIAPDGVQILIGRKSSLTSDRMRKAMLEEIEQDRKEYLEEMRKQFPGLQPPPGFEPAK
jgi:hypothetical protein